MFILSSDLYNTNSFLVSDFGLDLNNFNQGKVLYLLNAN